MLDMKIFLPPPEFALKKPQKSLNLLILLYYPGIYSMYTANLLILLLKKNQYFYRNLLIFPLNYTINNQHI